MIVRNLLACALIGSMIFPSKLTMPSVPDSSKLLAEYRCMVMALYFEARGESKTGIHAVANVIMNRVKHKRFPGTVCGVVLQKHKKLCQFSWNCDGKPDHVSTSGVDLKIREIAFAAVVTKDLRDITGGALFFHSKDVPDWGGLNKTREIGNHHFYSY